MKTELRAQVRLAAPLALGQLGFHLMTVVDTAMLGRFSDQALAGAGIANSLMWTFTLLGMGVIMGMDTLVPQAVGEGAHRRAQALLRAGVKTALWFGLPMTVASLASLPLMSAFGVESGTRHEAVLYIFGRLPAIIPFLLFAALRSYLQAYEVTRPLVIAVLVGNVLNVATNGLLIFGDEALIAVGLPSVGVPALGALGAAISTSAVTFVSFLICAIAARNLLRSNRETLSSDDEPEPESQRILSRAIFRLGWPIGLHLFAEVGVFALVATLAGRLGAVSAAAHQLALTVVSFNFNAIMGVASATSVRVGLAVGAGDHRAARTAGLVGLVLAMVPMAGAVLMYVAVPEWLAWLLTDQSAVVTASIPLFYVAAFFQLGDAAQAIFAGAARGAGDTRWPMYAHVAGHYGLGLAVGVVCAFRLDMGEVGLWWGLAAGLNFAGIVLAWRFKQLTSKPIAKAL